MRRFSLALLSLVVGSLACGERYVLGAIETGEGTGTGTGTASTASSATGGSDSASTTGTGPDLPQQVCETHTDFVEPMPPMDPGPAGMTWHLGRDETSCGLSLVRCGDCEAYVGDTACGTPLRVLCLRHDMEPNPGVVDGDSQGWSGGTVAVTSPRAGDSFVDRAEVDAFCEAEVGPGFRVAEFHDGGFGGANGFFGGWGFWAFGDVPADERYWTYIDDQPNCWAH